MAPPVVLITGCTTGSIGYALSEEFAAQGYTVYASSRRVETIAPSPTFPDTVKRIQLDVTDDESVEKAVELVVKEEGRIDVLVNNAGSLAAGPLLDLEMEFVHKTFDLNTVSILRVSKAVVPHMAKRKSGLIVNVGSVVGEIPTPWNGAYCASKAAVHSLSQVLAMELQPLGISVLHVAPGAITSNLASNEASRFTLPEGSLWSAYLPDMIRRINASQGKHSMPSEVFAQKVVKRVKGMNVKGKGGYDFFLLGGQALLFKVLRWIPTVWLLKMMWRVYSKKE